ncbi:MAG: hypothetical protein HY093_02070 [Candidatus Liptonbacteria bacterium]|nr:hypothetical protein [Candidatus Liptonbacteria bacterium]
MLRKIIHFFDRLEDKVRGRLSHHPILYTIIGAVAIVLFWRGVWMVADMFDFLTGWVSIAISVFVLLITGLFVSFFIGDRIVLSGLKGEKKLVEKAESEIETEEDVLDELHDDVERIEKEVHALRKKAKKRKK